ncbi:helix-turn-helix domain-containing protein [Acuticoccus kandeliae]|uniref:helix-turn-helix domain-containing protein n=1 Tax=Acuticoccus kandeliae TaxID=2073160 RepID=UPI0013009180
MTDAKSELDLQIGRRLKLRRRQLKLPIDVVALKLGISPETLNEYERGSRRVNSSKLAALTVILQIPVSYLFEKNGSTVVPSRTLH